MSKREPGPCGSAGSAAPRWTHLLYCFSWDRTPESHQEETVPSEEADCCSGMPMLLKTSKGRGTIQIKADRHSHHKQVLHVALNWAMQCRGENATTEFGTIDKTELEVVKYGASHEFTLA